MKSVYERIEKLMARHDLPLAPHEFGNIALQSEIGMTESALGRRLREMRALGRVTSKTREGCSFKEFALAVRKPVQQELVGQHSGGY